jgi:hypothetical protein
VRLADERQRQAAVLAAASEGYGTTRSVPPEFLRKLHAKRFFFSFEETKRERVNQSRWRKRCQLFVLHCNFLVIALAITIERRGSGLAAGLGGRGGAVSGVAREKAKLARPSVEFLLWRKAVLPKSPALLQRSRVCYSWNSRARNFLTVFSRLRAQLHRLLRERSTAFSFPLAAHGL